MTAAEKATSEDRKHVRTITFRTAQGVPGTVTGIPLDNTPTQVRMYSAGYLWDTYQIPLGATIEGDTKLHAAELAIDGDSYQR
jgi:hypothetical protein